MDIRRKLVIMAAVFGFSLALFLTGCHPISKSVRKEADRDLAFVELRQDPEKYRGKRVLLGGTIVKTEDRQEETLVEVHQKRLGMFSVPQNRGETGGRFLVVYPGLLDPGVYHEGRKITVGGEVIGQEVKKKGETEEEYRYPVVRAEEIHVWTDHGPGYYPYSTHFFYGHGGYPLYRSRYYYPRYYIRCY